MKHEYQRQLFIECHGGYIYWNSHMDFMDSLIGSDSELFIH